MLDFGTTAFISILFLVDPPGTVPAFISLTAKYSAEKRRKTALVASLAATLHARRASPPSATYIFRVLGLTLPAFQIAGGLMLFLVALDMIRAQRLDAGGPRGDEGGRGGRGRGGRAARHPHARRPRGARPPSRC